MMATLLFFFSTFFLLFWDTHTGRGTHIWYRGGRAKHGTVSCYYFSFFFSSSSSYYLIFFKKKNNFFVTSLCFNTNQLVFLIPVFLLFSLFQVQRNV